MRVLELCKYSPNFLGNFGNSLLILGKKLKTLGDTVVFCFPEFKEWMNIFKKEKLDVEVIPLRSFLDLHALKLLLEVIKKYKIEIIHTHFGLEVQVVAALAKLVYSKDIKVIWHWRNPPYTDAVIEESNRVNKIRLLIKKRIGNLGYRWLNKNCVATNIVVSQEIQNILYKRKITNVKIIHNGVELSKYLLNEIKIPPILSSLTHPLILNISNFRPQKDHITFLKAAKIVIKKYPQSKFILIGTGPTKLGIEKYGQELGIMDNLLFVGNQPDVRGFIKACDFTVLSSFYEGFPNVICESMALNKPVIATNVGGVSEIIIEGKNGFLIPKKSPQVMAEKITYLIEHPNMTKRMGDNGRLLIEKKFTTSKWVDKIRKVFLDSLERRENGNKKSNSRATTK